MRGFAGFHKGCAVFHGDSITLAVRTGVTAADALGTKVSATKKYAPYINAGVSGNTSTQGLARFEASVLSYGPSMLSLQFGTNDPFNSVSVGSVGSAGTYMDNMAQMIIKAQRAGARVTIWVPPMILDGPTDTTVEPYRVAARSLASTYSCDLFDTYSDTAALAPTTRASYYVPSETPDGIHWNVAGNLWASGLVGSGSYVNSFLSN